MTAASVLEPHRHAVKFYQNDQSLFKTVGGFLAAGLLDRQPSIVIATPSHRDGILADLSARMIDVRHAIGLGELVVFDAQTTLNAFMDGDIPNAQKFERHVGQLVATMVQKRATSVFVRAYGEMVDVLWKQGRHDAAVRLEIRWNSLAARYAFGLLCGYAMGNFYKEAELFERVCAQHTHVVPPDAWDAGSALQ